ncbi:MAG: WD40/YVTN/BNR-like repeat-containing protein, partial [Ekhidna sp.]
YGQSWTKITSGIPSEHFTRVLRADPMKQGLLYAGTEAGMYVSFDDGASWKPFQMNLPLVPITDLIIKNNNLIAATQGRSFWLIDDLTPLHQLNDEVAGKQHHLFKPMDSYRMGGGNGRTSKTAGANHPGGVLVNYFVKDTAKTDTIAISFHEADGDLIKRFSTHPNKKEKEGALSVKEGFNTMNWNMRYDGAKTFDGMILWWATTGGPMATPGDYKVNMSVNGVETIHDFKLLKDPRGSATQADLQAQFDFMMKVRDKLTETHEGIINIRKAKAQINDVMAKADNDDISKMGKEIIKEMSEIEKTLYQTKNESGQDPLNFPIRLNNKLGHLASLAGVGDNRPTDSSLAFYDEVTGLIDEQLAMLNKIFETSISEFNQKVKEAEVDAVKLDE